MSEHSPIYIALCCDDKYARHCTVTMLSVIKNTSSPERIFFAIFHEDFTEATQENILQTFSIHPCKISFVNVQNEDFGIDRFSSSWPKQVLYRFKVAELFPELPDKILYLDVDTLVVSDIEELWHINLNDFVIGAVSDYANNTTKKKTLRKSLGLQENDRYFNNGILLIDAQKWRAQDLGNILIEYLKTHGSQLSFIDQDAMNHILRKKWKPLPEKWNMVRSLFREYYRPGARRAVRYFAPAVAEAIRAPGIIHYTGSPKPWHAACGLPYCERYFEYLAETPWKDDQPENNTLRNRSRRLTWLIKRKLFG